MQFLTVLVLQRDIAALAIQHALLNVFSLSIGSLTRDGLHEVARVQHTLVGTHQQLARMRQEQVRRVRGNIFLMNNLIQPVECHIDKRHGDESLLVVINGHGETCRQPM